MSYMLYVTKIITENQSKKSYVYSLEHEKVSKSNVKIRFPQKGREGGSTRKQRCLPSRDLIGY